MSERTRNDPPPRPRKDVPMAYIWVVSHPEFWDVYENPLYTRDILSRGIQVHCAYTDTSLTTLLYWCHANCKKRFTHFSDPEIEGPDSQAFYFEDPDEAMMFKMVTR